MKFEREKNIASVAVQSMKHNQYIQYTHYPYSKFILYKTQSEHSRAIKCVCLMGNHIFSS